MGCARLLMNSQKHRERFVGLTENSRICDELFSRIPSKRFRPQSRPSE
jgi:hypothetical protein